VIVNKKYYKSSIKQNNVGFSRIINWIDDTIRWVGFVDDVTKFLLAGASMSRSFLRATERIQPCLTGRTRDRITGWVKGSLTYNYNPFTPKKTFSLSTYLLVAAMLPQRIFKAHRSAGTVGGNTSIVTEFYSCRWYGRDRRDRWRIRS